MDWDHDGRLDILSGCYWTDQKDGGYIHMLKGNGDLTFAAAELITDADDEPLQNVELAKGSSSSRMADNQVETICTQQHAVDYDDDGDLDLVVGCFGKSFYYYENFGTPNETALNAEPKKLPIVSPDYHAAPHLADWDGDGDLDLLSGGNSGGVLFSENTGTRAKPEWSKFERILADPASRSQQADSIKPGTATRVWTTDWNRDGKLDLLVGDTVLVMPTDISESKKTSLASELVEAKKTYEAAQADYTEAKKNADNVDQRFPELEEAIATAQTVFAEASNAVDELKMRRTGHVWLYIRK